MRKILTELPKGAFIVKVNEPNEKTDAGIYLGLKAEQPDMGIIVDTHVSLESYIGWTVKFRTQFGEKVEMHDGMEYMYFRDFDSSIYYVYKEYDEV